jgi:hypothetical protein
LTQSRWDADIEAVETVAYLTNGANQITCIDADVSGECDGAEVLWQYDAYGNGNPPRRVPWQFEQSSNCTQHKPRTPTTPRCA